MGRVRDVRKFWTYVEQLWDSARYIACLLALSGVGIAVWAAYSPRSPGVSIGLLALAAGIMSVRPKMHPAEKSTWVAVLVVLACLEVRAIGRSDKANQQNQANQNQEFKDIADGLKTALTSGNLQYQSTISHVNAVLDQTKVVNELAERSLDNITGGDSYSTLLPDMAYAGDEISLSVVNRGRNVLAGASLLITTSGAWTPGMRPMMLEQISKTVLLPTMHPEERIIIDRRIVLPPDCPDGDIQRRYITVQGPNFTTEEFLNFRKNGRDSTGKDAWEYEYEIFQKQPFRLYKPGQKLKKDQLLERAAWTTQWDPRFPIGDRGRALPINPTTFWSRAVPGKLKP